MTVSVEEKRRGARGLSRSLIGLNGLYSRDEAEDISAVVCLLSQLARIDRAVADVLTVLPETD